MRVLDIGAGIVERTRVKVYTGKSSEMEEEVKKLDAALAKAITKAKKRGRMTVMEDGKVLDNATDEELKDYRPDFSGDVK